MSLSSYHFYPKRIMQVGALALAACLLFAVPLLCLIYLSDTPYFSSKEKKEEKVEREPLAFQLGLGDQMPALPTLELQGEMTFSFDPPRPETGANDERLLVRLKKSAESRRVVLPCRIDLEYQRDRLVFAKENSPFWIELSQSGLGQIEGRGFFAVSEEQVLEAGRFVGMVQESPIQTAQEFPEGSPFRLLGEAKWWGRDLFKEETVCERLEIENGELQELKEGDWLVWKEKKWQKSAALEREVPAAHIQSQNGKALVLEGWDGNGHVRLSLAPAIGSPFKMKGEEVFSAIRVRSEKQISCMLEKQCMVLKVGDWVLKSGGRWKVLRKEQEKEAFLNGKLIGELFFFEQIHQKQGQKMIQGRLFNPGRTQAVSVELAAQSTQKKRRGKTP